MSECGYLFVFGVVYFVLLDRLCAIGRYFDRLSLSSKQK